jgi:hypothetical protein
MDVDNVVGWDILTPKTATGAYHAEHTKHGETHKKHVAKVEQIGHQQTGRLQLSEPNDGVAKGPDGRRSRAKERVPPPSVILRTQLVVDQENRHFSTRDNHNDVHHQCKTEHCETHQLGHQKR